ncbi:MAG: hypothetical protein HY979_01455 [Candidatus Magasanikbacteria bacterium]|nr:hypothetical protein [Candidatus Magasanikbacteria bacterium]
MKILRQYQLDIIFLFLAIILILWAFFFALKYLGADPHDYEWYLALPLTAFYLIYILRLRDKISIGDRRAMTTKSLVYWIMLGISLFTSYATPIAAKDYWSLNLLYLIFSLLLADSYWDFKKMTMKDLKK